MRHLSKVLVLAALAAPAVAAPPRGTTPRVESIDVLRRLDVNRLDLFVSNLGLIGYDLAAGNAGLYYPRYAGTTTLFASGLWVCGKVGGQTRVTVAEYSSEWQPGGAPGGVPENPLAFDQIVYKTTPFDPMSAPGTGLGTPTPDVIGHHSWSQYVAGAVPHGAPSKIIRIDDTSTPAPGDSIDVPGPDLPGDLATWCIYNDLDPSAHNNGAGSSAPLGLELKQTIYGYQGFQTVLDDVAYVRFEIRNASAATIDSAFFGFWADPDVGGPGDDLCGWDGANGIAYAYNATNNDLQYGTTPPAFGIALIESPLAPSPAHPFGASSFGRYISGIDPNSAQQSAWALHGFQTNGQPYIDPTTLAPTTFPFGGDPLAFADPGWLDTNPADRRMLLSVGPLTLAPGASTTLRYAIVVGQGANRLASIEKMRCIVGALRTAGPADPVRPFPEELGACGAAPPPNCPWTPQEWALECAAPTKLTSFQLDAITNGFLLDSRSFDPGKGSAKDAFCADVTEVLTARQRAEREYETLLANWEAMQRGIVPTGDHALGLPLSAPVSCPGLVATTVSELLQRCPDALIDATYEEVDSENPRDLQGVDWGGGAYNGGVGFAWDFLGSSLDPAAEPDSFKAVDIRFGETQKAYRYLRLQQPDGTAPPQGRAYLYGGYRDVPFRCVEVGTDRTLEVLFVERALTDENGTLLDGLQQFATFDSTWMPNADGDGGREYLVLTGLSAVDGPRPEFEQDGVPIAFSPAPPTTYALWLHRTAEDDAIEPGEILHIGQGPPDSPGVDRAMFVLARQDPDDPATIAAYEAIAACLAPINQGELSPNACDGSVPALATLVDANATPEGVTLSWYVAGGAGETFSLERRIESAEWTALGTVAVDGDGYVRYVDRAVVPGAQHAYRLVGGGVPQGDVSVTVPAAGPGIEALAVGARFAAGTRALQLALPSDGEVRFDVYSLAGRRLLGGTLGVLTAGHRTVPVPSAGSLSPGVYLVRVRMGGAEARTKALVLR